MPVMTRPAIRLSAIVVAVVTLFVAFDLGCAQGDDLVVRQRAAITEAAPSAAPARPAEPRKLLVFTRTAGYRHHAIPYGVAALEILGQKSGAFETVVTDDPEAFAPDRLAGFHAVCFLNTTGPVFKSDAELKALATQADATRKRKQLKPLLELAGTEVKGKALQRLRKVFGKDRKPGRLTAGELHRLQTAYDKEGKRLAEAKEAAKKAAEAGREEALKTSLMDWVKGGGGVVGIHAATDTYKDWPAFLEMMGGVFAQHPWTANKTVAIKNDDPGHPLNAAFGGQPLVIKDEIYQIKGPFARDKTRVLLSLDIGEDGREKISGIPGTREDRDYAVSWLHRYGKGRVFYCSLGHNAYVYWTPAVLRHYLAGIQFALGDYDVDARPSAEVAAKAARWTPTPQVPRRGDLLVSSPRDYRVDRFMGVYSGSFTLGEERVPHEAYVIADGDGQYRLILLASRDEELGSRLELLGRVVDKAVTIDTKLEDIHWRGHVTAGRLSVTATKAGKAWYTINGTLTEHRSPTLGAPPPEDAVVLLPFHAGAPPLDAWENAGWKALPDGSMQVGKKSNRTRQTFGDMRLHLEFRIPFEPKKRGQARGNSGVYLMDRYEVQLLDSFGLAAAKNELGALYGIAAPTAQAALPPLRWQTYDIEFRTVRFGPDGKTVVTPPKLTVRLNGRLIHDGIAIPRTTAGGGASKAGHGLRGPLMLQDHTNPLRFRNIWVEELKDEQ